MVSYP
jgi:hypothetical protein